ncbi:MAG: DUF547 domain-containing protein [Gilvibacter sp.]
MNRLKNYLLAATLLFPLFGFGQSPSDFNNQIDVFFATHVSGGKVDYKTIEGNQATLNELLELAQNVSLSSASAAQVKAFWINAYNLAVIKGIVDNYPIKSPLDKKGFFDKTTYSLAGKKITLNDIENNMIRPVYNDARIHFVLVCGANGCPPIINKAYKAASLDSQLQEQTKKALNNDTFIRVKGNKVQVSEIFKWYREDFMTSKSNLIDYINQFRKTPIATDAKVSYYTYDWKLNAQ